MATETHYLLRLAPDPADLRKLLLDEILPEDVNGALRDMKENGLPMNKKTFAYVLTATILGRDSAVRYVIEQDKERGLIA